VVVRGVVVAAQPAYVFDMARTLNNLSPRLADLGRHEEALSTIEEAVAGYRHLVATRNAFRRELAASLNNLSLCLADLHRPEDALAAIEEATTILWQLGRDRPNAIVPDLATSLWALAWVHDMLDLATDAAAVADRQAVGVYERLATRADASRRLPSAAQTLARMLDRLGRADEASAVRARYGLDPDTSALRPSIGLREFGWYSSLGSTGVGPKAH